MVETSRLLVIPLTQKELQLYLQAGDQYEQAAGLACNGRTVVPAVHDMVIKFTLPKIALATDDHYLFHTFWIVVEKANRSIVAELGFKGIPNLKKEIEIGYGTMPLQQGKGFMTEAVGGMLKWAMARTDVDVVLAETDETNTASIRVLRNNRFIQFDKRGNMLWWQVRFNRG
jgi:ribosomal-protein-alanine N-acetyltransferase